MGCVGISVTFNYATWVARYPEFSALSATTAQSYFNEACLYFANPNPWVSNPTNLLTLLNMLTAHIAALYSQSQDDSSPGSPKDANTPVGRISSAGEGSVNVQTAYDAANPEQWYAQTKYGASFWSATAQYRTMRYVRGSLQPGGLGPDGGVGFGWSGIGYGGPWR